MQYSVYPISMLMFNQKLENCQSVQNVTENFKFIVTNNAPLILSVFINSTESLIQSYEDLNFKNWGFFLKKIAQIFPDSENNFELEFLGKEILIKFRELHPHLAIAGKGGNEKKEDSTLGIDAALIEVTTVFKSSMEERIENAFKIEDAFSAENKASILQLSLNFLILESDLIKYTSSFLEAAFKIVELQSEIRLGCDRIIRITKSREITLFEIPLHLEETEEFSFWLQLSPYLDLSFEGDRLFASLKHLSRSGTDLVSLKVFLLDLRAKTSCGRIHFIIDKWLKYLEFEDYTPGFFKKIQTLFVQFLKSVHQSSLLQREYSQELEFEITPISFYLFKLINDHTIDMLINRPRDIPKNDLLNFKRVLDLWDIHKDSQGKLFKEANCQLSTLIIKNPRTKPPLQQYTQDLTGPAKGISGKMRPYPNELRILDQIERVSDLTTKTPVISSKPKIKPTSTSKKNTKKSSPKKISQPHQNASQPKEIVEIQKDSGLVKQITAKTELYCSSSGKTEQTLDLSGQLLLPGEFFPFKFDQRVQRWNDHSFGEPFLEKEFPEYYDKGLVYQKLMHLFHAPHHLVDRFLSFGIEGTWLNVKNSKNDLRYVIPAEITYENKTHRGLIVYAIDSETNVCYHRFFTEKMDQDILYQITNKVFNENDYPDLRDAVNVGESPLPKLNVVDSSSIKIEPGYVEIVDFNREVKIKLFKVKNF